MLRCGVLICSGCAYLVWVNSRGIFSLGSVGLSGSACSNHLDVCIDQVFLVPETEVQRLLCEVVFVKWVNGGLVVNGARGYDCVYFLMFLAMLCAWRFYFSGFHFCVILDCEFLMLCFVA